MRDWDFMYREAAAMADWIELADQQGDFPRAHRTLYMLEGYTHCAKMLFGEESYLFKGLSRELQRARGAFAIPGLT